MASARFCGLSPLLFGRKKHCKLKGKKTVDAVKGSAHHQNNDKIKEVKDLKTANSPASGCPKNLKQMAKLRKKIMHFRDIIDLPPSDSKSLDQLMIRTIKDLQNICPEMSPTIRVSEMKGASLDQVLASFYKTLKSIEDSWAMDQDGMDIFPCDIQIKEENINRDQRVENIIRKLDSLIKIATEKFDAMDDEDERKSSASSQSNTFSKVLDSCSDSCSNSFCASPATPTSVLPDLIKAANASYTSPLLMSLRVQAVGKLNPIDVKRLSFHMQPHLGIQHQSNSSQKGNVTEEHSQNGVVNSAVEKEDPHEEVKDDTTETQTPTQKTQTDVASARPPPPPPSALTKTTSGSQTSPPPPPPPPPSSKPTVPEAPSMPPPPSPSSKPTVTEAPSMPPPSPPSSKPTVTESPSMPPPSPPSSKPTVTESPSMPPPSPPPSKPTVTESPSIPQSPPPSSEPTVREAPSMLPPPPPPPGTSGISAAISPPPPPPPPGGSGASPPPMTLANGVPPPPPPALGAGKSLRPKKATKLKRSSQMGNLYRLLKGKVEGTELSKSQSGRKSLGAAAPAGGKQGMADALAEMTKRSAYFQQIEEDVETHAKSITELKSTICAFQTKDMAELLKFHKQVESVLEKLTDESQVLARFEGFPSKKLEALRMAAALYSKLDSMSTELQNWKVVAPLGELLDKVERYFNKIKGDIEALERTKDEESKKFQSHNIHFDFHILIKIKELMVDVSSSCMELALKESREATESDGSGTKAEGRKKASVKMLWRAFQFAFRVYNFAGGHDDRADKLTRELAEEIDTEPNCK